MIFSLVPAVLVTRLAKLKISVRSPAQPFCWRTGPYIVGYIVLSFSLHRAALAVIVTAGMGLGIGGSAAQAAYAAVDSPAWGMPSSHVSSALVPGLAASAGPSASAGAGLRSRLPGSNWCPTSSPESGAGSPPRRWPRSGSWAAWRRCCPLTAARSWSTAAAPTCSVSAAGLQALDAAGHGRLGGDLVGPDQGRADQHPCRGQQAQAGRGKAYPVSAAVREQVLFGGPAAQRARR